MVQLSANTKERYDLFTGPKPHNVDHLVGYFTLNFESVSRLIPVCFNLLPAMKGGLPLPVP